MNIQHRLPGCDTKDALAIRAAVFQDGQGIPRNVDVDGLDRYAEHFLALIDDQPVGTARYWDLQDGTAKVERVAVLPEWRGRKVGQAIMNAVEVTAWRHGVRTVVLDSQTPRAGFYSSMGFQTVGEEFDEVGIPHVTMHLTVRPPAEADRHYGPFDEPFQLVEVNPAPIQQSAIGVGWHPILGPTNM